jgi:hypothetical protein
LPSGVSSEDRHRPYADVAAAKMPSQRPGWLMTLTWDMVRYFADKDPTTRVYSKEFWLKRNVQTTCMTLWSATKASDAQEK